MGSSFVGLPHGDRGEVGFWANDAILGIWLVALASAVSGASPPWLVRAAEQWRFQGGRQFMGVVDAGLDECLITEGRVATVIELARCARVSLVAIAEDGYLRPPWLVSNQLAEEWRDTEPYQRDGVKLDFVLQVADVFLDLLGGQIAATPATSPVYPTLDA